MKPTTAIRLISLWPPLLFSGIAVKSISPDFRHVQATLRLRWWNKNAVGTMFGGSLFALTDPFYTLMLQQNLGHGYVVWDKAAEIEFLAPGKNLVSATVALSEHQLQQVRSATEDGKRHLAEFQVEVKSRDGGVVARVSRTVYVRLRRENT